MRIFVMGDIVGEPGRDAIRALLPKLVREESIDFVVVNGENAAGGSGLTQKTAAELFSAGIDVLTNGDHTWDKKEFEETIDQDPRLLRPANFPSNNPGAGAYLGQAKNGFDVGVLNLVGRVFMPRQYDDPFPVARREVERLRQKTPVIIVDIHAEATSEKIALGWFLDGQASFLYGTHTHVQTADERILPKGTAYLTDVGMTGSYDSVLGREVEPILQRFLTQMPTRFGLAHGNVQVHGALVEVDPKSGRAESVKRIQRTWSG